jgi:CheY-like chemotaxis protein
MKTILVVDDEPDCVDILMSVLRYHEFDVVTAADGAEAYAMAKTSKVDLVVSDYLMPGLDGIELTGHLAADGKTKGIPIVLMSGVLLSVDHASVHALIQKPFEIEKFMATVRSALRPSQAKRSLC